MSLQNLEPRVPMRYFLELSAIPRGSGNEKASSDWMVQFAKKLGLEVHQDAEYNVIIKKPGTAGYENAPRVILQGHLDMVCEKNSDVEHDFLTEGIKVIQDGEFLRAEGTTLGADNGVAVAYAMALLESSDILHPPLTVIMTSNEEVGLLGAAALDPTHLDAKYMINLDSGGDGVFTVGCAGGVRTEVTVAGENGPVPSGFTSFNITVSGLIGGHSGANIALERGNANKIIGRLLSALKGVTEVRVISLNGGDKDNAIPREASTAVCVADYGRAKEVLDGLISEIKNEYRTSDSGISISYEKSPSDRCFGAEVSGRLISVLNILPSGVRHYEQNLPGFLETSVSLGVMRTKGAEVVFQSSIRSSVKSRKLEVLGHIREIALLSSAKFEYGSDYPAWAYKQESPLREIFGNVYKELYGSGAKFHTIHGGLECGIILEKSPGLDIVAMGPTVLDNHSPDERMNIASFAKCWELLKEILRRLK